MRKTTLIVLAALSVAGLQPVSAQDVEMVMLKSSSNSAAAAAAAGSNASSSGRGSASDGAGDNRSLAEKWGDDVGTAQEGAGAGSGGMAGNLALAPASTEKPGSNSATVEASASDHTETSGQPQSTKSPWEEIHDAATKRFYYYNRETGASEWERPIELLALHQVPAPTPGETDIKLAQVEQDGVGSRATAGRSSGREYERGWEWRRGSHEGRHER